MEIEDFFRLIRDKKFQEAHQYIDDELAKESALNLNVLNHRRATIFLSEKKYDEALRHLQRNRKSCGSVTHVHETIAMIHELLGNDELALVELEAAPFDEEESIYPLLVADARFYRLFFRAKRKMFVSKQEIDAFPPDYESYFPADGHMRGVLIKKKDIVVMLQNR